VFVTRRDLLTLAARAAVLPGAAEFLAAWSHSGMTAPPEPPLLGNYQPKFFDAEDFAALQAFTEILIPTDDTPGAREAHCAHYIDFLLHAADAVPALQSRWRDAMKTLRQMGFHGAGAPRRAQLVETMSGTEDPVYRLIKELNTFAFYTSRAGMIETLDYRGNTFNATFPGCHHLEHHKV
jgi:hypothetical protein